MSEGKSLAELMREKQEIEVEEKPEEPEKKESKLKVPRRPRVPRVPMLTLEKAEELIEQAKDNDYEKIKLVKKILKYTKTEKALHTCGEILRGKSLRRTNKKILAREVQKLISEKILGLIKND